MLTFTEKQLQDIVKRRHPLYEENEDHWEFLMATYKGGREWFCPDEDHPNIFKYFKEGDEEYKDRLKRCYRFNHSREVTDLVNKYLFKADIIRREGSEVPTEIQNFWKNCTRNNENIEQLISSISLQSSISGRQYIVVDTTATEKVITKKEEKETGARVIAYLVNPLHVLDMSFDENGNLNWALLFEKARDDQDPVTSSGNAIERYRLWTRNEWYLFENVKKQGQKAKIQLVEEGEHNLGVVPIVIHNHIKSECLYTAPALINDIAYQDRAIANYLSNLDAIIQDQTFSQLVMPAQAQISGGDSAQTVMELGTKRIFLFDGEGGASPSYISPDPKQAELIITVIKQIINEIYHSVGMAGERTKQDNAMGIDNSSGVAKAYDFDKVNALLCAKAASLRLTEAKILQLVMLWNGKPEKSVTELQELITYPDSFDVRGLTDEFEIASNLQLLQAPPEVRKEQMRGLINKLFPRLDEEGKSRMIADIEKWPPDPMEVMKEEMQIKNDMRPKGQSFQGSNQKG